MTWWGTYGAVIAAMVTMTIITMLFGVAVASVAAHNA